MCQGSERSVVGLYDAANLDKVCTAARIKTLAFCLVGDVAEWLKAAVC